MRTENGNKKGKLEMEDKPERQRELEYVFLGNSV